MDKISTEISASGTTASTTIPPEKRSLSEIMHATKRSGGNYGSLAKSQLQPTFYVCHSVESDDTLQRLALKYSINVQEIKRVNKLWSDAELGLLESVFIPINSSQLTTLRTLYPTLNIVQNPSPTSSRSRKLSANTVEDDETKSCVRSSDSSTSFKITTTTTNGSPYQDYFSRIDQQIQSSKKSLQSLDVGEQNPRLQPSELSSTSSSDVSNGADDSHSSHNSRTTTWNNRRHKGVHHLSDNSVYVNIATQKPRDRHVSAALERIQREKDNFDEL